MVTFYEYLDWWVEERDEYPISLWLKHSFPLEAGKEVSIIASPCYGRVRQKNLSLFKERLTAEASEFLNGETNHFLNGDKYLENQQQALAWQARHVTSTTRPH